MSKSPQSNTVQEHIDPARDCQLALRVAMDATERIKAADNYNPSREADRIRDHIMGAANTPVNVIFDPGNTWVLFGGQELDWDTIQRVKEALENYDEGNTVVRTSVVTVSTTPAR